MQRTSAPPRAEHAGDDCLQMCFATFSHCALGFVISIVIITLEMQPYANVYVIPYACVVILHMFLLAVASHSCQHLQKTNKNKESDVLPRLLVKLSLAESLIAASIRLQPFLWDFQSCPQVNCPAMNQYLGIL